MAEPAWMTIARGEIGQAQETPGDNERILEYMAASGLYPEHDEGLQWCSMFQVWVFKQAGMPVSQPMAAAFPSWWLNYGTARSTPTVGCVAIRKTGYHTGFVAGLTGTKIQLLGGNQDDRVSILTRPASDYKYRWPPA